MRIGFSTSVIQRGRTGIAQYVFALLRAFSRLPFDHELVLFVLEQDRELFEFARSFAEVVPVDENWRPPLKNILWHQRVLPGLARRAHLDVLHVPSYRRMLWRRPCALVATIHDLAPFHVAGKYDYARMFYGRVVSRSLASRQHQIIAISDNTARDIQRFFHLTSRRVTVIYNGLDHTRFHAPTDAAAPHRVRSSHNLPQPFFLYVARLEHPGKNHVRLIKAFEHFKHRTGSDWQLALAGSDWHGAQEIHQAIQASPVKTDIRCLGFVAEEVLPELYQAADVFVYPSLYEGFGMPPLEAMASGCPVICSNRGSLGEVVGNAALIVDPEDHQAMAAILERVALDASLRARLREKGLRQATKYDWGITAARTLQVYREAAEKYWPAWRFAPSYS